MLQKHDLEISLRCEVGCYVISTRPVLETPIVTSYSGTEAKYKRLTRTTGSGHSGSYTSSSQKLRGE
jgi:hypothetical protein